MARNHMPPPPKPIGPQMVSTRGDIDAQAAARRTPIAESEMVVLTPFEAAAILRALFRGDMGSSSFRSGMIKLLK